MSMHFESGRFSFGATPSERPAPDTPFRLLVIADLGGRQSRGLGEPMVGRRARTVDIDNFDDLMVEFGTGVRLPVGDAGHLELSFEELEDFEPDAIYRRSDVFRELRALRKRLMDPSTFAQAAAVVQGWAGEAADTAGTAAGAAVGAGVGAVSGAIAGLVGADDNPDDDLARLLGQSTGTAARERTVSAADQLIRAIVGPHVVPAPDPRQDSLVASVDDAIGAQMRAILHHPEFKSLEAAWRSLHRLITSVETGEELSVSVIDASLVEVAADMGAANPETESGLYHEIAKRPAETAGGAPFAAIVFDASLRPSAPSATLLGLLGATAAAGGAVLIAGADDRVLGVEDLGAAPDPSQWTFSPEGPDAEAWKRLREHEVANSIVLAGPRWLVRLPYGPSTEPVDAFAFEEFEPYTAGGVPTHPAYLWGNGAFLVGEQLAQAFTAAGWSMPTAAAGDATGLPMHVWKEGAESVSKPIAEVWLTDSAANAVSTRGVTPLVSIQHRDAVRVGPVRSIAPDGAVACSWGR